MFWNFIGINLSNSIGFRPTSLIFVGINFLILLLTYCISYDAYESETFKYSYPLLFLIFVNWVLMAIFFGGSSLLAQQKFVDYYSLFDSDSVEEEEEKNTLYEEISSSNDNDRIFPDDPDNDDNNNANENQEEDNKTINEIQEQKDEIKKKNFKSLFLFGIANAIGYSGKYGIAIGFTHYKLNNMISKNETIFNNTKNNFSSINYFYSNNTDIYYTNDTDIISENYELSQYIFIYINIIYIGCILLSVLFYTFLMCRFFQNRKKQKEQSDCCSCKCCLWNKVCEICGYIIYSERIVLDKEKKSHKCCHLCCETFCHYFNYSICNMFNCRENANENICCKTCNYDKNHLDKERQCFCYCYQDKGYYFWVDKFFINEIQKEIILCVFLGFMSRISTIGCEVLYDNIFKEYSDNQILEQMQTFLLSFFSFFGFVVIFLSEINYLKQKLKSCSYMDDIQEDNNFFNYIKSTIVMFLKKFNTNFIGIFLILCLNIILGFNYSSGVIFRGFEDFIFHLTDKEFNEKSTLYTIIFTKAYLVFLINYYCLIIAKNRINFEFLLSQTIIVTLYLMISDYIILGIKFLLPNAQNIIWIQFITCSFLGFFLFIVLFRFNYFFILSACQSCEYNKGICTCNICCCQKESSCYTKCCELKCLKCNCKYICCEPCCSRLYKQAIK